jgi:glutamate synthase domain-containing protein 2
MCALLLPFTPRYILLTLALLGTLAFAGLMWRYPNSTLPLAFPLAFFGFFLLLGLRDLVQTKHAILRNYPIAAHIRFILEHIRPELRQYFFENEKDGMPFPRDKRAIVYQRAKQTLDKRPFGTHYDVYRDHYEWLHHSMAPQVPSAKLFRTVIGGPQCTQPYSASVFNISALSFGSVSANAIRALNKGAKLGGFAPPRAVSCSRSAAFSRSKHTDRCPTGVATQDRVRQRALVVADKSARVASFHRETVKALGELVAAAGLNHPHELRPRHFVRRATHGTVTFAELYRTLDPGELLASSNNPRFREAWAIASADSFAPAREPESSPVPIAAE